MIVFQDQIELFPAKLDELRELFKTHYFPAASARGMTLLESRVSPPLHLARGTITLWQRWQVSDVQAWWGMRAQAGTEEIAGFWQLVDTLCTSRERVYFSYSNPAALPAPQATESFEVTIRGHRETAQLALKNCASNSDKESLKHALGQMQSLPELEAFSLSPNLAPEYASGDFTLDLLFADAASADRARASTLWTNTIAPALDQYCKACHAVTMETLGAGLRAPALADAIKRTAFFRLLPGTDKATARRFEQDLLEMPAHITEILNWRLSRAVTLPWDRSDVAPWTYVWEQEFATLDDLLGPYMSHPHHWAHIDRWFDPESGVQAVDTQLSHAFSPLGQSLISKEIQS